MSGGFEFPFALLVSCTLNYRHIDEILNIIGKRDDSSIFFPDQHTHGLNKHMNLKQTIHQMVNVALQEDIGSGDLTAALIASENSGKAQVIVREPAVLCGIQWFDEVYKQLDPHIEIVWHYNDGQHVDADKPICELQGSLRHLLSGERTALNFVQTLSATATAANKYAQAIDGYEVKILDTRKTLPGFRLAQKYAVRCGGCFNHRIGLFDAILIKENHIISAGSITSAVTQARKSNPGFSIEVEIENLAELNEALTVGVDRILLDNMDQQQMRQAVAITAGKAELEASGGISLSRIREIAETGIDYISVGDITKNIQSIDLSMRFIY